MDKALKKKWVKALVSGKYEQGNCVLEMNGKFCCLGVLQSVGQLGGPTHVSYLNDTATEKAGLSAIDQSALAHLNDDGVPFEVIAGLIDTAL